MDVARGRIIAGVLAALALGAPSGAAETDADAGDWTLAVERNGVEVYERGGDDGAPEVRATTRIGATPLEILAVLADDARRVEWMARASETRLVARRDRWDSINYTRLSVWPFQDRDVVVHTHVALGPDGERARVDMVRAETPLAPPVGGVLRMPAFSGAFELAADGDATVVAYHLKMDFGGKVPERIQRYARWFIPLETLEKLRAHVPAERETYAERVAAWRRELSTLDLPAVGSDAPPAESIR